MAKFKIIISDPETGKARFTEVEGTRATKIRLRRAKTKDSNAEGKRD